MADPATIWIGLEYFCNEGDSLWSRPDHALIELAKEEMGRIGILDPADVLDGTVVRMEKAYPAYFGSYERFPLLRSFLDGMENLIPIGRNGMHRYNNQDHSMLAAMTAVDQLVSHPGPRPAKGGGTGPGGGPLGHQYRAGVPRGESLIPHQGVFRMLALGGLASGSTIQKVRSG